MSIEAGLVDVLAVVCPRVYPVLAPLGAQHPHVTFQNIGGRPLYSLAKVAGDKRLVRFYINVWSLTMAEALSLMRQIEAALVASTNFIARVESEPISEVDADVEPWAYRCQQEFTVIAQR